MYREQQKKCPACNREMAALLLSIRDEDVIVDLCSGCDGAYFEFVDGTPAILAREMVDEGMVVKPSHSPQDQPAESATCLECTGPMEPHPSLDHVFRCKTCWNVFCGARALHRLAASASILEPVGSKSFFQALLDLFQRPSR